MSGAAPYTMALVTSTTRRTRAAALAVSTVCAARRLYARRSAGSESSGVVGGQMDEHVDVGDAVRQERISDVDHSPRDVLDVAALLVDGHDPAEIRRRGELCEKLAADARGRAGDGDDRGGAERFEVGTRSSLCTDPP